MYQIYETLLKNKKYYKKYSEATKKFLDCFDSKVDYPRYK